MPVSCTSRDRLLTVAISGEVDHHGAKAIMLELDRQINQCLPKNLTLDLSGVTFMDSSGIAVLLRAWRKMGELEGSVSVLKTPPQAAKVLRTAGVSRFVRFES